MTCGTMTELQLLERGALIITNRSDSNDPFLHKLAEEREEKREEKKRRIKMKGDPNELRKKANNKSTRPKWLDRK